MVKNLPANAGDTGDAGSIPGSERSRGGNGNPLQYSCQENSMSREAQRATACGVTKADTTEPATLRRAEIEELLLVPCCFFQQLDKGKQSLNIPDFSKLGVKRDRRSQGKMDALHQSSTVIRSDIQALSTNFKAANI